MHFLEIKAQQAVESCRHYTAYIGTYRSLYKNDTMLKTMRFN